MTITAVLVLASLVEGFTEYAFGKVKWAQPYLMYFSLAVGVAAAVAYQIDFFAILGLGLTAQFAWINWVVSGLLIGRGSNYLNDIVSFVGSVASKNTAYAEGVAVNTAIEKEKAGI